MWKVEEIFGYTSFLRHNTSSYRFNELANLYNGKDAH
jgi:hypothetical protein